MTGDLQLTCNDCGREFTFSSEDQAFFRERGYSTPKRCKVCRQAKKNEQGGGAVYHRSESQGATGVGSRLQSRLSRGVTVPYIARTATGPRRKQAAVGELVNEVSNRPGQITASRAVRFRKRCARETRLAAIL
jgi:hypothetical protein